MPKKIRRQQAIPVPYETPHSLRITAMAMKERLEVLSGARGKTLREAAVTWDDLVELGLIKPEQVPVD